VQSRLNPFDDFLIHQAATSVDVPATTDPHFNDGYWFGFHTHGRYAFMGLRVHPNNNVIDGYAGMVVDGEQRSLRFSRALRPRTNELSVGPLRIEVVEPLQVQRITLGPNDMRLEWDVRMDAYGLWPEARHLQHRHGVVLNDLLRYTGVCQASGWASVDGMRWRGPEVLESSRFDVSDHNTSPFQEHLPCRRWLGANEFAARLEDSKGNVGMATIEHMAYGTYRPYGFEGRTEYVATSATARP
jgi:hypothetical protein